MLKRIYESEIGKEVSDITWRRVTSILKREFDFKVEGSNAASLVVMIGEFRRKCGTFNLKSEDHKERWEAFKHFHEMNKEFSGKGFLNALANYLKIELKDVPRSTKYYWFNKAGISYQSNQMYGNKDLALVAFIACKWAINKRPVVMKSANPEAYKLTIGRSNNNG